MKKTLGIVIAAAVVLGAYAIANADNPQPTQAPAKAAEAVKAAAPQAAPTAAKPATPAAPKAAEVVKAATGTNPTETTALENCKKKGLIGTLLDECVKKELASAKPATPGK